MSKLDELNRISSVRRTVVLAGLVLAPIVIAALFWYALQTRAHEYTAAAEVMLLNSGKPMTVQFKAETPDGRPLAGRVVSIGNRDGGVTATTDAEGAATFDVASPVVEYVDLDGVRILDRPYAARIGYPTAAPGLLVKIVVKQ